MVINERKQVDPLALAFKQVSIVRAVVSANAAFKRGEVRELPLPAGVTAPPARELRVKSAP